MSYQVLFGELSNNETRMTQLHKDMAVHLNL